jgi:small subunit ribosomal protein S8
LKVLQAEGFIQGVEPAVEDGHPVLKIQLRYVGEGQSMITGMERISKPGVASMSAPRTSPRSGTGSASPSFRRRKGS